MNVRMYLHPWDSVELSEALEILAYCLFDGKVDQKSELETRLYDFLLSEFKSFRFQFGF